MPSGLPLCRLIQFECIAVLTCQHVSGVPLLLLSGMPLLLVSGMPLALLMSSRGFAYITSSPMPCIEQFISDCTNMARVNKKARLDELLSIRCVGVSDAAFAKVMH
jgi:hypothetical protein